MTLSECIGLFPPIEDYFWLNPSYSSLPCFQRRSATLALSVVREHSCDRNSVLIASTFRMGTEALRGDRVVVIIRER